MADKFAFIAPKLTALLGRQNVTREKEKIVARLASSEEIAAIFNLAGQADMTAIADKYAVGPSTWASRQEEILISLDRMNQIRLDRDQLIIAAQPGAEVDEIIDTARETGFFFPGRNCQHKQATVGDNVAACFTEGEPDFKCLTACLCGLELVLANGSIVTAGEPSAKDLDNYQLTYILGGYKDEYAVISGIYLKLLPGRRERYWLITKYQDMDMVPRVWPLLGQKYRRELDAVVAVKLADHPELAAILRQWAPNLVEFNETGKPPAACMLLSINCPPGELELILEMLTDDGGSIADTVIAGDTYQRHLVSNFYSTLLESLEANPQLSLISIEAQDYNQQIETGRLAAVYWLKDAGKVRLFYI